MPINERELISVISDLCRERQIMTTVSGSLRGAAIVGFASLVGGLLLGPIGLAVGGTVGGFTAAYEGQNNFRPLYLVITEDLTQEQRRHLTRRLESAVREFEITDLTLLLPFLLGNQNAMHAVLRTIGSFIESEMQLKIVN
uniref:Uncharacterized protein n=1 Tax=Clastoptera arizonana TaxID=38151 RepID=A0A1B6DDW5_9HEMI